MATTLRERQAKHRKNIKNQGKTRFSATLDSKTAATIRRLAEQHNQTQAEVIKVAIILADRALSPVSGDE